MPPPSMVLASMATRLRAERERRNLTLEALAGRAGLSKAHLSRIESGERQPTVATLLTLARALDVRVATLLGEDSDGPSLQIHRPGADGIVANGLTIAAAGGFTGARDLSALRITLDTDRADAAFAQHAGEEWLHILIGTLSLDHDGTTHLVTAGSSVHFDARRPHRLRAPDGYCELLLIATSATERLGSSHP